MKIKPIGQRLVLKEIQKKKLLSGILMPDSAVEKPELATVACQRT